MKTNRAKPTILTVAVLMGTVLLLSVVTPAQADENNFGYTYGSETLPKGHWEVYQWVTSRTGKIDGHYAALDLQTEFEYGLSDHLQVSFYVNAINHDISGVARHVDRKQFRFNGLQAAFKYSLKSPYKDGYGLALYLEPGYKRYSGRSGKREDIYFLEPKLIFQKNLLEGSLVWATNLSAEFEREHDIAGKEWESELELQFSSGLSYRFAPGWFVGAETLFTSAFERMRLHALGEYAIFAGPNLHYATQKWWATLAVMPQLAGWPDNSGGRDLHHFEKLQVRLKIGLNF